MAGRARGGMPHLPLRARPNDGVTKRVSISPMVSLPIRDADFIEAPKIPEPIEPKGSVFAKSCNLPDAVFDYPTEFVPTDAVTSYGDLLLLGGRTLDAAGTLPLKKIGGAAIPSRLGTLALGGAAISSAGAACGTLCSVGTVAAEAGKATAEALLDGIATRVVVAGSLVGLVALLWPSSLGDSSLYPEDQLRTMSQARTRMRLRVEEQADGTLKGYGFYTGKNRNWEMINVVPFKLRGTQQVADFGNGVELIWSPAIDPHDTLGVPALESAPQVPNIWIFPPSEAADSIIVSPLYPPEYRDFILVFPVGSGIKPVYVVLNVSGSGYTPAPLSLPGFPDALVAKRKTTVQGGGLRKRWRTAKGQILEWDSQHAAVEKYDKRGRHLGEFDAQTGTQTKEADETRRVEP